MKFKDKDGNVFEDIKQLLSEYCYRRYCSDCMFYPKGFEGRNTCGSWAENHPAEAARLMGYEVVEDYFPCDNCMSGSYRSCDGCGYAVKKEDNMDKQKPLDQWTTGEVREYCSARNGKCAHDCLFSNKGAGMMCKVALKPCGWDLFDYTNFTDEEVADARAIMRLLPCFDRIRRSKDGKTLVIITDMDCAYALYEYRFPSILPGQSVKLSDIVGGGTD